LWPPARDSTPSVSALRGVWSDGQGFERPPLHDRASVQWFLSDFDATWNEASQFGATRLHLSTMVTENGLLTLRHQSYGQEIVEAVTPLDPKHSREKMYWVQFGLNTTLRNGKTLSQSEVCQKVGELKQEKPWTFNKIHERVPKEYSFEELEEATDNDLDDLMLLWERFGCTPQEVELFVESPYSYIRVARHNGRIVASARLELTPFTQASQHFQCAEHTDAATLTEHEGNGLYAALLAQTQMWLSLLQKPPDIMYGVSNVDQPAVLRLARRVGRKFAVHDGQKLGFPNSGILRKDSPISVQDGEPDFRDLLMSYHTPLSLDTWVRDSRAGELR
jgi:hypothetical protein